jgi:hypothetical protein
MTYGNPSLSLRWHEVGARLLLADMDEFVERLRVLFPELILFPRCLHHRPSLNGELYENVPIRFWDSPTHYRSDPILAGGLSPHGLILRIPWPEDLRSGDPERLIGGRNRHAYEDGPETFRRFGRVVYLDAGMSEEIATVDRSAIADFLRIDLTEVPAIRFLRHYTSRTNIGFLYDAGDREMLQFEKLVRSCLNGLTTTVEGSYDIITKEPLDTFKAVGTSLRLLKRCALEDDLYVGPGANQEGRVSFIGPAPRLLKQVRAEVGMPYGRITLPKDVKKLTRLDFAARREQGLDKRLPKSIDPDGSSER